MDQYAPALLDDGLYFADGQMQDEVYVYGSFLQSRMAQVGVTCSDCHEPHSSDLRLPGNALCSSCHAGSTESVPIHITHEKVPAEATCVSCHMPERTYMGIDERRDHRFAIPDPISSHAADAPRVCANCHEGRDTEWEAAAIAGLQLDTDKKITTTQAVMALRAGQTNSLDFVREVLIDSTTSRIAKGSMISRLARFGGGETARIGMVGIYSGDAFERVGALRAVSGWAGALPMPNLINQFEDELRWVRVEAVAAALSYGYDEFDDEPARSALNDYIAAQEAVRERPQSHINLAHMYEILGGLVCCGAGVRSGHTPRR